MLYTKWISLTQVKKIVCKLLCKSGKNAQREIENIWINTNIHELRYDVQ